MQMRMKNWILTGAALLIACPIWATTYYGGFEDRVGHDSDYDYNDVVFSLSGDGLALKTSVGHWFTEPTLGTSGTPFWNNGSLDGSMLNVGYCIYGGGNCGVGLEPSALYLATQAGNSVNDVYFSIGRDEDVNTAIDLKISSDNEKIGYYLLSNPGNITWFAGGPGSDYTFDPHGHAFGIAGKDMTTGNIFYSNSNLFADPGNNHFAWFDAPEPGVTGLMASGLIGLGLFFRRKKSKEVN
jgi:hypothetical protein